MWFRKDQNEGTVRPRIVSTQVAVTACGVEIVLDSTPLLGQPVRALELLQPPPCLRRGVVVVVDGRVGQALLDLTVGTLQLGDERFDVCHELSVA